MDTVPAWWHRNITAGMSGGDVDTLVRKFGTETDVYDADLAARVTGYQNVHGLPCTGVVDASTASALGESELVGLTPPWWDEDLGPGSVGLGVRVVRGKLGMPPGEEWDDDLGDAVARFQSHNLIRPTGLVGLREAKMLAVR